jgi:hypothetical protein
MGGHPLRRRPGVVERCRKGTLGRQPVVYGYDDALGAGSKKGTEGLELGETPQHETAAMEEDENRTERPSGRGEDAEGNVARFRVGAGDLRSWRAEPLRWEECLPRISGAHRVQRWVVARRELRENRLRLRGQRAASVCGIEDAGHGRSPFGRALAIA